MYKEISNSKQNERSLRNTSNKKNAGNKALDENKLSDDVWIILPGHNEEEQLTPLLEEVSKIANNVVFVDDGSTDKTYDVASSAGVVVLRHITNLGKGGALRTGCDYAVLKGAKKIIVMDSDGQHDPEEISKFIEKLNSGFDVIVGCRKWNSSMPMMMRFGNYGLHKISSVMFNVDVKDTQSGYRAFTSEAYRKIRWASNDYSMESEMLARLHKHNLNYSTVDIKTIYHNTYKGTTVMNGIRIAYNMLLWKVFGLKDSEIETSEISSFEQNTKNDIFL